MAQPYQELRQLSKEDLIRQYDRIAPSTMEGLAFIREQIARRDMEEYGQQVDKMTQQIRLMTGIILVLTFINVGAVIWSVLGG